MMKVSLTEQGAGRLPSVILEDDIVSKSPTVSYWNSIKRGFNRPCILLKLTRYWKKLHIESIRHFQDENRREHGNCKESR